MAEAGATVVCAAWIRFERGTEFATLWGSATLPEWPIGQTWPPGAASRYLETDASDDSRPILERLGFTAVTTTTAWVWSPPTVPAAEP